MRYYIWDCSQRRVGVTDVLYISEYSIENMACALVSTQNVEILIPNTCLQAPGPCGGSGWLFPPRAHRVQAVRISKTSAD